jgi:hypothetical protein
VALISSFLTIFLEDALELVRLVSPGCAWTLIRLELAAGVECILRLTFSARGGLSEFIVSLSIDGGEKILSVESYSNDLLGVSIRLKESMSLSLSGPDGVDPQADVKFRHFLLSGEKFSLLERTAVPEISADGGVS